MYTCIIIDDQLEAVDLIKDHVQKIPQLSVQLMTTEPLVALSFLEKCKPDIIFLDIEMPELTGIEFIENLKAKWGYNIPKIVFTTGYSDYALAGFEHGAIDYILKPVVFSRFKKCIDRVIDDLDKRVISSEKQNFFFAEDDGKKIKINFEDIILIEGAGNYIVIYTNNEKKIIYKSMNSMQNILPNDKFIRVHKSYIIAVDKIQVLRGNELNLKLDNEKDRAIPIGITFKEDVLKKLGISS